MGAGKPTRRLVKNVCVHDEDSKDHWFGPEVDGGKVPGWAAKLIDNPTVWDDGGSEDDSDGGASEAGAPAGYDDMKVAELTAEIDRRNFERVDDDKIVPSERNKAAYVEALVADDATKASAAS